MTLISALAEASWLHLFLKVHVICDLGVIGLQVTFVIAL